MPNRASTDARGGPPGSPRAFVVDGTTDLPPERELSLTGAEQRVYVEFDSLGWQATLRTSPEHPVTAAVCELHDRAGVAVPDGRGCGKGAAQSAAVGALFEALEHAFTGSGLLDLLSIQSVPVADIVAGSLAGERAIGELARHAPHGARIACLPYTQTATGATVDVPVFLWAPWFTAADMRDLRTELGDDVDYRRIKSYSVNTGCAIGASENEAVLHALNECVERDAFALFLLRSVHDGDAPVRRLDPESLPADSRAVLADAEGVLGNPIELFDLTTDLGVPVVLAYDRRSPSDRYPRYGMGASLSATHALRRAVCEVVQSYLLASRQQQRAQHARLGRILGAHPRLLACAHVEVPAAEVDTAHTAARFAPEPHTGSVATQREVVTERLRAAGHEVFTRRLATLPGGTTTVQVQCPGLERFHLITDGHVAVPGQRARRLRRSA